MLLLAILAATVGPTPPAPKALAQASVRIQRPAIVTREDWEKLAESARSEIILPDEQGRPILLRLIEHQ